MGQSERERNMGSGHTGKKWSSIYKAFPSTKRESKYIKWKSQSVFAH